MEMKPERGVGAKARQRNRTHIASEHKNTITSAISRVRLLYVSMLNSVQYFSTLIATTSSDIEVISTWIFVRRLFFMQSPMQAHPGDHVRREHVVDLQRIV